jgi:mannose-6-phosphate isomerase-like protein (cupin superfamily)
MSVRSRRCEHRQRAQSADDVLPRVDDLRDPQIDAQAGQDVGVLPSLPLLTRLTHFDRGPEKGSWIPLSLPERRNAVVKISDKTDYSRFSTPDADDEGIWLDHAEVHLVTHPVGQVKELHVHDPPQDHVITMRSGHMRWTVDGETFDAGPGDVIVTPAGVAHSYVVLGDEPAKVVCVDSPAVPRR